MEINYAMNNSWAERNTSPYSFKLQGIKKAKDEEQLKQDTENQKVLKFLTERMNKVKEQIAKLKCDDEKSEEEKEVLMKELKLQLAELNETYMLKRLSMQEEERAKRTKEQKEIEDKDKVEEKNKLDASEELDVSKNEQISKALIKADGLLKQNKEFRVLQAQMQYKSAFLEIQIEQDISRGFVPDEKIEEHLEVEEGIQNIKTTITKQNNEATKEVEKAAQAEGEETKASEATEEAAAEKAVEGETEEIKPENENKGHTQVDEKIDKAYNKKTKNEAPKVDIAL